MDVGFDKAFLQDSGDPQALESEAYATGLFDTFNTVDLNINPTEGLDACRGDAFIIQASFVPPQDAES